MATSRTSMRFLLSNGDHWKEKLEVFPLGQELAASKLLVVCVKNGNEVVAACGIRSPLNVLVLYVRKDYRAHGLGAHVLREALRAAVKRALNFVTLSVSPENVAAFHLYVKAGFKEIVYLEKPRLKLMMLPLTFLGKICYAVSHVIGSLVPNTCLSYIHERLYGKTLLD